MAVAKRTDPFLGFRFKVEIDDLLVAGFTEVSGVEVEVETEDYREGGVNDHVHRLPGGIKHTNVTLTRGVTDSDALWKWQLDVVRGRITRKTVRILVLDTEGQQKLGWRCLRAYPTKWAGPSFKADSSTLAIERLELAHLGIERT